MTTIIFWSSLGILFLALVIGFLTGLVRGLKRSAIHIGFLVGSIVVAFLITKVVTNAILGITLPIDDGKYTVSEYILKIISKSFDISAFDSASTFVTNLPNAVLSPIIFLILCLLVYIIFDIAYLITVRLIFGKKKDDFKENKPYRAYGAILGIVEGLMMIVLMFGPISSLTGTYKELTVATQSISTKATSEGEMKNISDFIKGAVPSQVDEIILAWDKSACAKLPRIFGLNNALFDNLSSFKVKGEKIVFRKEITNFGHAYNDFVDIYNTARKKQYTSVDFTKFRKALTKVLDGNIFEVVVSDSFETLILDYSNLKTKLPFTFPTIVDEIFTELQTSLANSAFDCDDYIKQDVFKMLDTVESVFRNDLINKYNALENKSDFAQIMKFVSDNNSAVGKIANNVMKLNIVEDSFNFLLDKASTEVSKIFEDKEFEVKLNTDIEDVSKTIDDLLYAVDSIVDLNRYIDFSEILTSEDIVETLTNVDDIYTTMKKIGVAFDTVRNIDLLTIPQENAQPIYVFDNILKNFGVDVLGDEVYPTIDDTTKITLDTYTKFFTFLAEPIDFAKDLGLTDLGKEGVSFNEIFDSLLFVLKYEDSKLLTKIVMPFYQLNCMDLKTLVFDKVINNLSSNVSLLSFEKIIEANDYHVWVEEFNHIGQTLSLLNSGRKPDGTSEIEGYDNTYIKYLMSETSDLEKAMKAMLENNRLGGILDEVFTARVFENLTKDVFDVLDDSVRSLTNTTGLVFETDISNLKQTKQATIETIEGILNVVFSEEDVTISQYGKIMQLLKINALNNGSKDGVFNNIFINVIWYLTGDDLTANKVFASYAPHKDANDIKAFLNATDYYAEELDFEVLMAKVESAISLAKKIEQNVDFTISFDNTLEDIVDGIGNSLADMTEEEKVKAIENLDSLLKSKGDNLLDDNYGQEEKEELVTVIDNKFGQNSEVGTALKNMLGL